MEKLKYLFIVVVIVILAACYIAYKEKKDRKYFSDLLQKEYGNKPINLKKKIEMQFIKDFFEMRKDNEDIKNDYLDDITWNDLDMDSVFRRINYTRTTLGEEYLYYKLRRIENDSNKRNRTEKLVQLFQKDDNLRNELSYNLQCLSKIYDRRIYDFIYNPEFNKLENFYVYPLLAGLFAVSILSCFVNIKIGFILTLMFFCINILIHQKNKMYFEDKIGSMTYILNNIVLLKKVEKIKNKDFEWFSDTIKQELSKCSDLKKLNRYSKMLGKTSGGSLDAEMFLEYFKMFFMVDVISYQGIMNILQKNREQFIKMFDLVAEIDLGLSIAYYRESLEGYSLPSFNNEGICILDDLYHPLIDEPVKNSITVKHNILFTGSNASGKSTFIKSVALNIILAQTINTALCSKYNCIFSKVITSMAIRDNVLDGDSYFIAEIKSLKRLVDALNSDVHIFTFVDEILKGTNTIERISASASIMKYVSDKNNVTIFVATHDIELTKMLEKCYANYHFSEIVTDDGVDFDYKLKEGPSTTRNAIKLLNTMGFDKNIIESANSICSNFDKNQKWQLL